ncbi:hypothetical protein [Citrobacter koseri]|uniref:hypothetical protein n=1 Tax=Citrobacter koseri TaxID=545 RepID=UPI000DFB0810|nr:hypothetical protein [Citrobacter koseri]STB73284.1 Uncharacterised protein [Citrobacter koseri]STT23464.1 Uncharacterised protein [Citrobacter koseri]
MRLGQLYRHLGELPASGVNELMPVCIPVNEMTGLSEVDRVTEADGVYSEDASPIYAGFLQRRGAVVVVTSGPGRQATVGRSEGDAQATAA